MDESRICGAKLRGGYFNRCSRCGTIYRGGKWWCKTHAPLTDEQYAEIKKQRIAKYKAEEEQAIARMERSDLECNSGIRKLSNDDLKRIISYGGIHAILRTLGEIGDHNGG